MSDGFRTIAEWHVPNRIIELGGTKTPFAEILSSMPIRCSWCKRERKAREVLISGSLHLLCIDEHDCNRFRTRALRPNEPKKKGKGAKKGKQGSEAATEPSPEVLICGDKTKIDGKVRKCQRKPDHKGRHKGRKGHRW